jgi:hypothetical protein
VAWAIERFAQAVVDSKLVDGIGCTEEATRLLARLSDREKGIDVGSVSVKSPPKVGKIEGGLD